MALFFHMNTKREVFFITGIIVVFFTLIFLFNYVLEVKEITLSSHEDYIKLTRSLLQNRLDLDNPDTDYVLFNNKYYWHLGPFPSIFLIPFVAFSEQILTIDFKQGYIQFFITLAIFFLILKLAKFKKFSNSDSAILAFSFIFSTVYIYNAFMAWSWYFLQTFTVLFSFLSLHEFYGKKRWWLISLYMGILLMSRPTSALIIIFFILSILFDNANVLKKRLKYFLVLLFFPVLSIAFLLLYNYARFENPFNSGYTMVNNWYLTDEQRFELINLGLFKLENIPSNIYYYFLKGLDPVLLNRGNNLILVPPFVKVSFPGTSLFIVSPILLYVFKLRELNKEQKFSIISIVITLSILLTYYWPGWLQLGPRYTLDFLPLLYLLLLSSFKDQKVTKATKLIIILSAFFNVYLYAGTLFKML
ncbi:hypothetical protein A3B64_01975 [candidate division WWE3 bacterium RIFCSPLOWO2_01_FULL_37_24]|nr:MAG: hypothetical protein A2793_02120 [candidate division WWE3 bacterium RIFCSPHIGHO2_01_FULL_38_45]OGC54255.1 MAG: hypothetical protein A3B64_01975 [candidate division WWE3 bacterium RIFCSPLOWO2_01_FULL_37_24]